MLRRRILFWYVLREITAPCAIGLLVFTFILLMNKLLKLVELLVNKGVSLAEVVQLVWYLLPSFLVLTLPISILLGLLICLGKLSADAELIALKASGVSLYQLLAPAAVVCCAGFVATNVLTLYLLPHGNYAFRKNLVEFGRKHSDAGLEEGIFIDDFEGIVLYINAFDKEENRVNGIFISDRRNTRFPSVIVAEHALIFAARDGAHLLFELSNGAIHRFDQTTNDYQYALFNTYSMNIRLAEVDDDDFKIKYREMDTAALWRLSDERRKNNLSAVTINVEIHKRLAFPFACLVFGLLGVALGGSWRRGGRSFGFIACLLIVFLYYLFLNIGENLAKAGYVFAWMGIWLPNIILGSVGISLFLRAAREQTLPLAGFERAADRLVTIVQRTKNLWTRTKAP